MSRGDTLFCGGAGCVFRKRLRVRSRFQLLQGNFPIPGPCCKQFWGVVLVGGRPAYGAQVYAILDEVFLAGEIEETSKEKVLMRLEHLDKLE